MALQNRVTPFGELTATPERGLVYGNRGCLHDARGRVRRHHNGRRWIACRLRFRDWHRGPLLQPGRFTELFFLDEATAFAAGHRPCALCRHEDYQRFGSIWSDLYAETGADAIDARLHAERLTPTGTQRRHRGRVADLPDGAFVGLGDQALLVLGGTLRPWSPAGYGSPVAGLHGVVDVITPPSLVAVLAAGWTSAVPVLHPSSDLPSATEDRRLRRCGWPCRRAGARWTRPGAPRSCRRACR